MGELGLAAYVVHLVFAMIYWGPDLQKMSCCSLSCIKVNADMETAFKPIFWEPKENEAEKEIEAEKENEDMETVELSVQETEVEKENEECFIEKASSEADCTENIQLADKEDELLNSVM